MSGPDVYGVEEARAVLEVSAARFHILAARPEFPPARQLSRMRVWDGAEIRAYARDRKDGRERGTRSAMLRVYRRTGVVAQAARAAGVDPATARRWLRELDVPLPRDE